MARLPRTLRIPLIYGLFSILWIVITDRLSSLIAPSVAVETKIAIAKGIVFVLLSTLLIYILLKADERHHASLKSELTLLEDSFSLLFDKNPQPMWVEDPQSMGLLAVNSQALELFGYSRDKFITLTLVDLADREEYPLLKKSLENRRDTLRKSGPWKLVTHAGKVFYAYILVVNMNFSGRPGNLIEVVDITEQKKIEETLKKTADERDEFEAFGFSVSHDLRAHLRAVSGYGQVLSDDYGAMLDEKGREYLKNIQDASQSMGKMLDDLLMLSKISRKNLDLEFVDLGQMAKKIDSQLKARNPTREVTFLCVAEAVALADASLMQIALFDLMDNAWKYTSKKTAARVEFGYLEETEGSRVFFLKDNGVGFDPDQAKGMFKPFERFHPETEFAGSGIGLSVAARIIERHKGKIWAEGQVGRGATFFFTLGVGEEN